MQCNDRVLVLTPVKDAQEALTDYFDNLLKLDYPRENLSLGFLESDSRDKTHAMIQERLPELGRTFRRAQLWKKDFGFAIPDNVPRWAGAIQHERRSVLAKSRNHLLFRALDDEDWVLWLDVDVAEYPADIIQRLLSTGKDIIHPNCVMQYQGKSYDLNAWRDRGSRHLHDLRDQGDLVELHAVGGTMLLIKADIHREGLVFPPFLYGVGNKRIRRTNHFLASRKEKLTGLGRVARNVMSGLWRGEIETEGLGIMAHDMGYTCWGMPNLEIKHR